MIESTTLRQGNYVMDEHGVKYGYAGLCVVTKIYDDTYDCAAYNPKDNTIYTNCKGITQPIPITEEWLINLGFTKQESHLFIFPQNTSYRLWGFAWNVQQFSINTTGDGWDDVGALSVSHIHQLQNIFHALTGKELQIC